MSAIELYTWATPNGRKASIMLEELGLEYNVHPIDISKGEQFQEHFLAIAPNNRIPCRAASREQKTSTPVRSYHYRTI